MSAYYNEIDPYAAQWLRNLIAAGHIADGEVDTRSISDVEPYDLREFTQCHFFAGIGVWSLALRNAGWPDDRPVWTGSCPCQPFSSAGRSGGFTDERHLWPHWHHLIRECQPAVIFGEQVASKATEPWIDLVQADLEGLGYAMGGVAFPAAGIGSPHIRDRFYWVGNTNGAGLERYTRDGGAARRQGQDRSTAQAGVLGGMADPHSAGLQGEERKRSAGAEGEPRRYASKRSGPSGGLAHLHNEHQKPAGNERGIIHPGRESRSADASATVGAGPVNGFWGNADWLLCRDGKWRPVEPGTFPLANGVTARVGRLRAYGNAINAEAAKTFIAAFMGARP